jgi:hypothetical protein
MQHGKKRSLAGLIGHAEKCLRRNCGLECNAKARTSVKFEPKIDAVIRPYGESGYREVVRLTNDYGLFRVATRSGGPARS